MDPESFTKLAQQSINQSVLKAIQHKNPTIEPIHLLYGVVSVPGPGTSILKKAISLSWQNFLDKIDDSINQLPQVTSTGEPHSSSDTISILGSADSIAKEQNDTYISQEVLLLALSKNNILKSLDPKISTYQQLVEEVKTMRQGATVNNPNQDANYQILDKYTVDYTNLAKEGKLDPVIGRDPEIRRVMQVLSRRTKNNPVLIGEPGVGKTAIVEGLAQRIVSGDVPLSLQNKHILSLEMASVLAGAKFRGEFEERLKSIIDEIHKRTGEIILFIDELHTIAGAGSAEGAVDAANMLKPGLARGTLRVIGATTLNEYRQHIEKDAALERRFQPVLVEAPSVEDSISILRGLKEKYEVHHGIRITDAALVAAAKLSDRYIPDRFLPDKAIDLVDEAASAIKIQAESSPQEIDTLKRTITQQQIELKALKKEKGEKAKAKIEAITEELENNQENLKVLEIQWQSQKEIVSVLQDKRNKIDEAKVKLEQAEREVDLDEAAKIKYGKIPSLQKEVEQAQQKWESIPSDKRLIKQAVDTDDIAGIVARWTGIPVTKLMEEESQKLTHLEVELGKRVIGQKEALKAVAAAIRRSRAGLSSPSRPIASFLFLGPTGVGKTETAKALAQVLFDKESALVRIDMSEYSERHSLARLIGAPPGYIGYEAGGQLTEVVRRHPYSVILFDEIEKAHPQVFNLFLQIFDDGRLTDGQGRTVNFKNTVLIMTSNLGAKIIQEAGDTITDKTVQQVMQLVEDTFPPEFINRLDQIIMYEPLSLAECQTIVGLKIGQIQEKLKEQDIKLKVSDPVLKYLAQAGYDPIYGARPLDRLIQSAIMDELAMQILDKDMSDTEINVNLKNNKITLDSKKVN
jgi:ATP-dependent Clp protease ATP-binding subunit ClpB